MCRKKSRTIWTLFFKAFKKEDVSIAAEIDEYIIKKFSTENGEILNQGITIPEILQTKKLKEDKVHGPDGLSATYYKSLKEKIILPLQKVMNDIYKKNILPPSWQEAHITLIHKEGNDPLLPQSYSPI